MYFTTSKHHKIHFFIKVLVLCTLQHPNIIQFLGICFSPLCFVIEFAPMGSLYDILEKRKAESKTLPVLGSRMNYLILFQVCYGIFFKLLKMKRFLKYYFADVDYSLLCFVFIYLFFCLFVCLFVCLFGILISVLHLLSFRLQKR